MVGAGGGSAALTLEVLSLRPPPRGAQSLCLGDKLAGQSLAELRLCSDFLPSPSPQMGLLRAGGRWEEKSGVYRGRGELGIINLLLPREGAVRDGKVPDL